MGASIFLRTQKAFVSNLEIGLAGVEARCRGSLGRSNVREMDVALEEARRERFAAEQRRERAAADERRLQAEIADWQEKAAFAVGKDRSDLAERALAAQLDAEAKLVRAAEAKDAASNDVQRLQGLMDEIQVQRREMAARARTLDSGRGRQGEGSRLTPEQRAEIARANFDRIVEDSGEPGLAAAAEPDASADLEALVRSDEVARRLAELRSNMAKAPGKSAKKR